MKFAAIYPTVLAFLVCLPLPAQAYIMPEMSYPRAFERSDLVVIARPVTRTTNTKERSLVDGFGYVEGKKERLPAIGVETAFEILMVVKGESPGKRLVLHHYREQPAPPLPPGTPIMPGGGPMTVFFQKSEQLRKLSLVSHKGARWTLRSDRRANLRRCFEHILA